MKRLFNFMAVLVAVSALAASCAKPELESTENGSVNSGLYDGPVKTLTFEAVIGETPTKTTLGDHVTGDDGTVKVPVLWENGDKVDVHWKNGEESASATGEIVVDEQTGKANFSVKIPESLSDETVFYAVYPSGTTASLSPESGDIQVTIPIVTGSFKKANIMVARCSNAKQAPAFSFKHACGIIRFETGAHAFKDGKKVSRVSLYGGHREYIRGNVSLNFTDDNTVSVTANSAQNKRYANAEDIKPNSECYVAVYPDYEFANGIIVNFYNEQLSVFSEKAFTISRGQILNLGNVEARINDHRDFYFKPTATGTGDATSWENAGDIAKFRELLTEVESEGAAYGQRMKLDNTNYHFMEGEYQLAEGGNGAKRFDLKYTIADRSASTPLNFYGGYSAADPTVRDPQRYETVFTGNKQYAILAVRDRVILNLDGIVFENARAKDANAVDGLFGAALFVSRSSSSNNMPEVHVNNCVFRNNEEDVTQSLSNDYGGGSALNLYTGKLYVNNCEFTGNISYNRGPVRVGQSAADGSCLFFNSCTFTGNYAKSGYGRLLWAAAKACRFGMNNCIAYSNDSATTPSTSTGVLALNSPYVLVNNTFVETTKNSGDDHGIIRTYVNNSQSYNGTIGVFGNNIIVETSSTSSARRRTVYTNVSPGYSLTTISYGNNVNTKTTYSSNSSHTSSDKDKTGVLLSDLSNDGNYYYWTPSDEAYVYATSSDMVDATKANSLVGDSFHDWLVEIGAIVNGQFTDCRGYIRPATNMRPGAYDPNAQPTL